MPPSPSQPAMPAGRAGVTPAMTGINDDQGTLVATSTARGRRRRGSGRRRW
jgi:hypothetical protein